MEPNQTTPVSPASDVSKPKTSYGALVGLLVVVAAVVLGAWYFLSERVMNDQIRQNQGVESLQEQGTSTEAAAIQGDLEARSPDEFNEDLDEAFAELEAAFEAQ